MGEAPFVVVLGIAQDGGVPQAGCRAHCCAPAWSDPRWRRRVACLGIVDPSTGRRWIVDATPDFREQLRTLDEIFPVEESPGLAGIFLTHAHSGHYTGLLQLGPEAIGASGLPIHVMPRMGEFLESHEPWRGLVRGGTIVLHPMRAGRPVSLGEALRVAPFQVPHRDELSETVGFRIQGPRRSVVHLPDVDRWEGWSPSIEEILSQVDVAYLDGTFHGPGEVPGRDLDAIPHPFVSETLERFSVLPDELRTRVRFLHLNHTNPLLRDGSEEAMRLRSTGSRIAVEGERVTL